MSSSSSLPLLTNDPSTWANASLLSVEQIDASGMDLLMRVTKQMKTLVGEEGGSDALKHRVLATVFYEASTRTSCSFQAAMLRLGGSFINVNASTSSTKKGESLEDTVRCLECYTDVTILRHFQQGSVGRVVEKATKPVINAGDGVGEHPTQALLDVFTIFDELQIDFSSELVVCMVGDLKHGRTVHSLAKLLARLYGNKLLLRYCSPETLDMPQYIKEKAEGYNVAQQCERDLVKAVQGAHVLYVTRVQKERFETVEAYNKVKDNYVVDPQLMAMAPPKMIVMHPLPRVNEISTKVDNDERAAYFRQMENGMFVRMALLALVLGKA